MFRDKFLCWHCRGRVILNDLRLVINFRAVHWLSHIKHIERTNHTQALISCLSCSIRSVMLCSHRYQEKHSPGSRDSLSEYSFDRLSFRSSHCSSRMQVEPAPAPPTVLPEASVPSLPAVGSEPLETTAGPPPVAEEAEQPTFHVMQPPIPTPVAPSEPAAAAPPTTYAQLIAVPIASDQPVVTTAPTAPVKQAKRVCFGSIL